MKFNPNRTITTLKAKKEKNCGLNFKPRFSYDFPAMEYAVVGFILCHYFLPKFTSHFVSFRPWF